MRLRRIIIICAYLSELKFLMSEHRPTSHLVTHGRRLPPDVLELLVWLYFVEYLLLLIFTQGK